MILNVVPGNPDLEGGLGRVYHPFMDTVESIEKAVEQLGRDDLASFREWFSAYEAAQWDAQIEQDIAAGKLDELANAAIEEFEAGKTKVL